MVISWVFMVIYKDFMVIDWDFMVVDWDFMVIDCFFFYRYRYAGWWWLEHEWIIFTFSWEWNNHPNWRTHILQRGRYTTNQKKHMRLHQLRWVFDDFPGWDTEDTDWRQDVLIQPATVTRALVVFAMVRAVIYKFLFVFSIPQCILWFPSHFLQ